MTTETIGQTMRTFREQPEKAKGKPQVKARSEGPQAVIEGGRSSSEPTSRRRSAARTRRRARRRCCWGP